MDHSQRLRAVCTAMAVFCLVAAGVRLLPMVVTALQPSMSAPTLTCSQAGCRTQSDLASFLPSTERAAAGRDTEAAQGLSQRAAQPGPRALLLTAAMFDGLPAAFVFVAMAVAFRRFASGAIFGAQAILWLKRAALGGIAFALSIPLVASLRATALTPALSGREQLVLVLKAEDLLGGLFLSGVLWVAVWALQEGRRIGTDLAGYV